MLGVKHKSGVPKGLYSDRPSLDANIRLGWKCIVAVHTLAYYDMLKITAVKSFVALATISLLEWKRQATANSCRSHSSYYAKNYGRKKFCRTGYS